MGMQNISLSSRAETEELREMKMLSSTLGDSLHRRPLENTTCFLSFALVWIIMAAVLTALMSFGAGSLRLKGVTLGFMVLCLYSVKTPDSLKSVVGLS